MNFYERVYEEVRRIPRGKVATYGQIARRLGAPRASRAVGYALRRCPGDVPWHRVVGAGGRISAHDGALRQEQRLTAEGVTFAFGRCDLDVYGWLSS